MMSRHKDVHRDPSGASNPIVSVIVPTHDRASILPRAINSVLRQTYPNLELIVVDDASQDHTAHVLESIDDPRIKYLHHTKPRGAAAARNTGIRHASGDYIAFLDSDDEWFPSKLAQQIQLFCNSPSHIGAVYTGLAVLTRDNHLVATHTPTKSGDLGREIYFGNCVGPLSTVAVRSECLQHCGLFDERLPSCQDWDLYIRIAQKYYFYFVADCLVKYYVSQDAITADASAKAHGHAMVLHKYQTQITKDKKAHSRQRFTIGYYLCCAGRMQEGQRELCLAIFTWPLIPKYYFYYLCSLFGTTAYRRVVSIRRFLRDALTG